ncbi:uncharacterized protein LOC119740493 [Patiria miniata]|uniref:Uncharacterized protein n=1 Tax=Patiria miniata TaxID=46514 RepID=A0A914B6J5_PATMI|nr:uncharacterized protein LOC119740493 [Patiria miniata]
MNGVSAQQCGGPVGPSTGAVSVLVATYSVGGEGSMPESTFTPDGEAWTTKNARRLYPLWPPCRRITTNKKKPSPSERLQVCNGMSRITSPEIWLAAIGYMP